MAATPQMFVFSGGEDSQKRGQTERRDNKREGGREKKEEEEGEEGTVCPSLARLEEVRVFLTRNTGD